jgi:hypothetical protein
MAISNNCLQFLGQDFVVRCVRFMLLTLNNRRGWLQWCPRAENEHKKAGSYLGNARKKVHIPIEPLLTMLYVCVSCNAGSEADLLNIVRLIVEFSVDE